MRITERERECLLWAARGKTYAETAIITGVSYGSVKRNLDIARWKMDASTVTQAVAIAVGTDMIKCDELYIPEVSALRDRRQNAH